MLHGRASLATVNQELVETCKQPQMASPSCLNEVRQHRSESLFQIKELENKNIHYFSNPRDFSREGDLACKGFSIQL